MTARAITLRPALSRDIAAISDLLEASWLTVWAPQVSAASRARFAAERTAHAYARACWPEFIVAIRDETLVGLLHQGGEMIHSLHVAPPHKGTGVGSALMDHAEARGAARLEVRCFNTRAIAFYRRRGWRETRRYEADEFGTMLETLEMCRQDLP